jgi:hypothetical protein
MGKYKEDKVEFGSHTEVCPVATPAPLQASLGHRHYKNREVEEPHRDLFVVNGLCRHCQAPQRSLGMHTLSRPFEFLPSHLEKTVCVCEHIMGCLSGDWGQLMLLFIPP